MESYKKIVGAAFGNPLDEKVFSGVSKYLFKVFESRGQVAGYVSTKNIRLTDMLDGLADLSRISKFGKPVISRNWLWKRSSVKKLSERFERELERIPEFDAVIQIGTHVWIENKAIDHYCYTDMTIKQAIRANQFSISNLDKKNREEAISVQNEIFTNAKGIFTFSNWAKRSIVEEYGIDQIKVHAVGAGASMNEDGLIYNKQCGETILFIGRDWERKGGKYLIESFELLKPVIPSLKLIIIGCSPSININGVHVLGDLDKTNPKHLEIIEKSLRESSVLCVPSLFEPFGICFLEAQLYGIVPLTFRGQGREDTLLDNKTGILVNERDSRCLANSLQRLLSNKDKLGEMGKAGRIFVKENLLWDKVADRIWERLLKD